MNPKIAIPVLMLALPTICAATSALSPLTSDLITPSAAVDSILASSHRLQALRMDMESQTTAAKSEASTLPGPEVEFEHLWGSDGNTKWNAGISQSVDWPGVYGHRKAAAQKRSQAFEALYRSEQLALRYEADEAIGRAVYAAKRLALLDEIERNMTALQQYVKTGFERGQLTILDVKKIDLELYTLRSEIAGVRLEAQQAQTDLAALNNGRPLPVDVSDYRALPLDSLDIYLAEARENNPGVQSLAFSSEAAMLGARAADAARLPGLTLGYRHAYEERQHFNGLSVGISLPVIGGRGTAQAARIEAASLSTQASAARARLTAEVTGAYKAACMSRDQMRGLSAVTLDDSYPRLLDMAFKGGQINVLTYIQELNYYLNARRDYLAADYAYRQALMTLNRYRN